MNKKPPLVVGPYVGELGWEIISWQPLVRNIFMQEWHESCLVFGKPGRSLLYPFAEYVEVEGLPQREEECIIWHNWGTDFQKELNAIGSHYKKLAMEKFGDGKFEWFWYDRLGGVFNDLRFMQGRPDYLRGDGTEIIKKDKRPVVVLCVRDRGMSDYRNWEYADWHDLAKGLVERDYQVVTIGSVRDREEWELPEDTIDLTNKTTINDCINLFHQANIAVGGNTGTIHLASRCGCPHVSWGAQPESDGIDKVIRRVAETNWIGARSRVVTKFGWKPPAEGIVEEVHNIAINMKAQEKGKVLITFDDGTIDQYHAAKYMSSLGLKGIFSVVGSKIGTPGYLSRQRMKKMVEMGHAIASHSYDHRRLGQDTGRMHLDNSTQDEITKDLIKGQANIRSFQPEGRRYCIVPFGSHNVNGQEHLDELRKYFDWIRLTVGGPMQDGGWTITGNKRLYPVDYRRQVIGITVAADMRFPDEVREKVQEANGARALCVLAYHQTNHVVGNTQNLTWDRFKADMDYIAQGVVAGDVECVLPEDVT